MSLVFCRLGLGCVDVVFCENRVGVWVFLVWFGCLLAFLGERGFVGLFVRSFDVIDDFD